MFHGFSSAIVGVDGSAESIAALEQARDLLAPGGSLSAVTVCEERLAVHAGFDAAHFAAEMHEAAVAAQARAAGALTEASLRLLHGRPTTRLLTAARQDHADLLAVGSHERSRMAAVVLGSVATEVLHRAPETVLVARPRRSPHLPAVVVGVDGSPESLGALAVARWAAARAGAPLVALAAEGGKGTDAAALASVPDLERRPERPVETLLAAAEEAALVVVGSRGLHGLAALGSVGERVAHGADCSVLVVRGSALAGVRPAEPLGDGAVPA